MDAGPSEEDQGHPTSRGVQGGAGRIQPLAIQPSKYLSPFHPLQVCFW